MTWQLNPDRYFAPEPQQRKLARDLYSSVQHLPIVSPHGHVEAGLFTNPASTFGTPSDLLITSDHYVFRMLYSQGVPLEQLGLPDQTNLKAKIPDPREIWQVFANHFHLFRGTPTGNWLQHILIEFFAVTQAPNTSNAQEMYSHLEQQLQSAAFAPSALLERFKIETLCTTDAATDSLEAHQQLAHARVIRPTFRPDSLIQTHTSQWKTQLQILGQRCQLEITDYPTFIAGLEQRRVYFKQLGAVATDHDAPNPHTESLSAGSAMRLFAQVLRGHSSLEEHQRLNAHLLLEMARMSSEDGLVMQLHAGSHRNHNTALLHRFGANHGSDIPIAVNWTSGLRVLLEQFGNHPRFSLIAFTLDESTYGRELAPLAGHYPALKLGPPWWFFDSPKGIERYLDAVVETAGFYNLAGFNDDCRNFLSIPVRHDVWRRVTCNWLAGQVLYGTINRAEVDEIALLLAYQLAKRAYNL